MEKAREDGAQIEERRLQVVVDVEWAWVQSLEVELHVEQLQVEGNDVGYSLNSHGLSSCNNF